MHINESDCSGKKTAAVSLNDREEPPLVGLFLSSDKSAARLVLFLCYSNQTRQGTESKTQFEKDVGDPDDLRKHHNLSQPQQDIGDILQRIMAITDESLDEAQAR